MYSEPKLHRFIIYAMIAITLGVLARGIQRPEWLHLILTLAAAVFAFTAAVVIGEYFLWLIETRLRGFRQAWYSPLIRLSDNIKTMSPAQLAYIQEVIPFKMTGKFAGDEISWWISAPRGDIPLSFLTEYLEKCEAEGWETLIPQHGMADNMEREYVARIHELMVFRGFATRSTGNQRGRWLVAPDIVYAKLGLEEA